MSVTPYTEYLRRNLIHAKACGARANLKAVLDHLRDLKRVPQWLIEDLEGVADRIAPLPDAIAAFRNLAPDAPDYMKQPHREGHENG